MALNALKQVPNTSCHYAKIMIELHVLARMEALESENQALKKQRTEVAPGNQTPAIAPNDTSAPTLVFSNKLR